MAFVITEPCISTCDTACVQVCPVDCIHGPIDKEGAGAEVEGMDSVEGLQLYIHPDECIDCGACEPECPVEAIYAEDDLPEESEVFIEVNTKYFELKDEQNEWAKWKEQNSYLFEKDENSA